MLEDATLERAQLRTGLDSELVREPMATGPIDGECLRLPSGPVEPDHELAHERLAIRVCICEALELADELCAASQLQRRIHTHFERDEPLLLEAFRIGDEVFGLEIGERASAPEAERHVQFRGDRDEVAGSCGRAGLCNQTLEAVEVELAGLDAKQVARRAALDALARK